MDPIPPATEPPPFDFEASSEPAEWDEVGNRTSVVDANGTDVYTTNVLNQYTEVADANYTYDDAGNMTNDGQYEYVYDAENRLVQVHNIGPLAAACDTDLVLATGGDAEWFNQMDEYFYGGDAAQSGAIGASEETWMEATVIGPGYLTFRYKLESGSDTSFSLRLDGGFFWSGGSTGGWYESGPHSIPSGSHTLRWRYSKGSGGSSAGTAWVDYVQWTGDVPEPNDWQTTTYTYDPAGRRIAKAFDGDVAIRYVYDGAHCIAEYDANDVLLRKFVYGPGIDQPICMTEVQDANAVYYYHFDGLGSVVALSDASGDTVQVYEYSVYGQPAAADPNHPNPFLFTARRYDPETGLYHYRARAYNPYIGRFLQTDPAGQGINAYTYCRNRPVLYVDPSGEQFTPPGLPPIPGADAPAGFGLPPQVSPDVPFLWCVAGFCVDYGGAAPYPSLSRKWTINDFFNWYRHAPDNPDREGWGATVDIGLVGLLDDFQNHAAVEDKIALAQDLVSNWARQFATAFKQKWEEYSALSYEEMWQTETPPSFDHAEWDILVYYDFAPGSPVDETLAGDPLVVFGEGHLTGHVNVGVGLLGSGTVGWGATIEWVISDPFSDPEGTGTEWALCRPYNMTGTWWWSNGEYICF